MRHVLLSLPLLTAALPAQEPPAFLPNPGLWPPAVHAMVRHGAQTTWIDGSGFTTQVTVNTTPPDPRGGDGPTAALPTARTAVVRVDFVDGSGRGVTFGARLPATTSFYLGNDPRRWAPGVPHHASTTVRDVWSGVDVHFGARDGAVAYDLQFAAGVAPESVGLRIEGAESLAIDAGGALAIDVGFGTLRHGRPIAWQPTHAGERRELVANFVLGAGDEVRFTCEGRDPSLPLVIDPPLLWNRVLGGSGNDGIGFRQSVDRNDAGELVVCGYTNSASFPYLGPTGAQGVWDGFVASYTANGALQWSALIGGTLVGEEFLRACRWDQDSVFFGGFSSASDFPTTPGALQPALAGPFGTNQFGDMVVGRLTPVAGVPSLSYGTFLGGPSIELVNGLAVLPGHRVAVTGWSNSLALWTHPGAAQPAPLGPYNAYLAILDPSLAGPAQRTHATWWGGAGNDDTPGCLVVDHAGRLVCGGYTNSTALATSPNALQPNHQGGSYDGYVVAFDPTLSTALYCTYLGGPLNDQANDIAIHPDGTWVIANWVGSFGAPIVFPACAFQPSAPATYNGYVLQLDPSQPPAQQVVWGTYLGGNHQDGVNGVAVDSAGRITVTGSVETLVGIVATTFPTTTWCNQPIPNPGPGGNAGHWDAFVARFDPRRCGNEQLVYASFVGGTGFDYGHEVVLDERGRPIVAGVTSSQPFLGQVRPGGAQDIFLLALDLQPTIVDRLGSASPGCSRLHLDAYYRQTPAGIDMTFACSAAPANSVGVLLLGVTDPPGTFVPPWNVTTHLALGGPIVVPGLLVADALGLGSHRFVAPYTPPANLAVQALWFTGCAPFQLSDALGL